MRHGHIVSNNFYFNLKHKQFFALRIFFSCSRLILTTKSIFPSSIATVLTFRLYGYYAEEPGLLTPDYFSNFIFAFFFLFPTDRSKIRKRIRQETKKRG